MDPRKARARDPDGEPFSSYRPREEGGEEDSRSGKAISVPQGGLAVSWNSF